MHEVNRGNSRKDLINKRSACRRPMADSPPRYKAYNITNHLPGFPSTPTSSYLISSLNFYPRWRFHLTLLPWAQCKGTATPALPNHNVIPELRNHHYAPLAWSGPHFDPLGISGGGSDVGSRLDAHRHRSIDPPLARRHSSPPPLLSCSSPAAVLR